MQTLQNEVYVQKGYMQNIFWSGVHTVHRQSGKREVQREVGCEAVGRADRIVRNGWRRKSNFARVQPVAVDLIDGDVDALSHDVVAVGRDATIERCVLDAALRVVEVDLRDPVAATVLDQTLEAECLSGDHNVVDVRRVRVRLQTTG